MPKRSYSDIGMRETDAAVDALERRIAEEYRRASEEVAQRANDYFARFADRDAKMLDKLNANEITVKEYQQWRQGQMLTGARWEAMRDTLASDYTHANEIAMGLVNGSDIDVYALNMNYLTYDIERIMQTNTSFTLYNHDTVEMLLRDNPDLFPQARVDIPADLRWNRQHINSAITQGILQGDSIDRIARRLQSVTDMNHRAAIRNARTLSTSAQNAGRMDAMRRASDMGIDVQKQWVATLDNVTRDSHVDVDGEIRRLSETFSNGLDHPGSSGPPEEVYNCRCSIISFYPKYDSTSRARDLALRNTDKMVQADYDAWKRERGRSGKKADNRH